MFLKGYQKENLKYDIPAGIITALVSIPIAMGYAQVAGLPPVYGLYGSLLPVLVFGLISSSPRIVFGVDAAPAALCGSMLFSLGFAAESEQAMTAVPAITMAVAVWLLLFGLFHAGRLIKFISTPVMGGFVSGICCEIILMQTPKLFGGDPGRGEVKELVLHIVEEVRDHFNLTACFLGIGTIAVILILRKVAPRIPAAVIMMFVGALLTVALPLEEAGVNTLPKVRAGLPPFHIADLTVLSGRLDTIFFGSFSIALVIAAETLLTTSSYAMRYDDKVDNDRELLAYAASNFFSALTGCCPTNGSVSRTGIVDQFGVKSQMMSLVSSLTMVVILLLATGFISYLPVPVLTGIVIASLITSTEFDVAKKIRKVDKAEWVIFWIAFAAVLLFGAIYGVLAGVILSFLTVILRESDPSRDFLGAIPGTAELYPLNTTRSALPICDTVIYQFKAPLFFANIDNFTQDIEGAIKDGTKYVIVDASGIGSVDITAAEKLLAFYRKVKAKGIRFLIAGHTAEVNQDLRQFGAGEILKDFSVRPTVRQALLACGLKPPYPLEEESGDACLVPGTGSPKPDSAARRVLQTGTAAFEWAFGSEADRMMEELSQKIADSFEQSGSFDIEELRRAAKSASHGYWGEVDEDDLLDRIEARLLKKAGEKSEDASNYRKIEEAILEYRTNQEERDAASQTDLIRTILEMRIHREREFERKHPELVNSLKVGREHHRRALEERDPELARLIASIREELEEEERKKEENEGEDD